MKERFVIVIIAVTLGLAATTLGFFIYQSTKIIPDDTAQKISTASPKTSPTPMDANRLYIVVDEPKENILTKNRTVQVKGKTNSNNTLIISTNQEDVVAKPSVNGTFSASIAIDAGTNLLITRAIAPNGNEILDQRVISFSAEDF